MSNVTQSRELAKRRLLVVEDDVSLQPLVGSMVKKLNPNSEIDWVTSYDEALEKLETNYDLVLADVNLGEGKDGTDLAQTCLARRIPGQFVFMTGVSGFESEIPTLEKPFRFQSFEEKLAPYLVAPEQLASPATLADLAEPVTFEQIRDWFYAALFIVGMVWVFNMVSGSMVRANSVDFGTVFGPTVTSSATSAQAKTIHR
jgi:CheY-like chemotaxis protein